MQLTEVSAKTGYVWYRQGVWLFRRNPLGFLTIFFTYLLAMWAISLIPVVGAVLPLALIPGVAVGFMTACRDTVAGKIVFPTVLVDGFRSYGALGAMRLIELGGMYLAAIALVFAGSALADGGALFKLMMGTEPVAADTLAAAPLMKAIFVALVCYVPVAMLFWFAPILTAWHDLPPVKAMFFSFVTCWRNRGAFIVYGVLWFATAIVVSIGLSLLMNAIGATDYAFTVLFPASITLTTMLYCSFYATYRGCYGVQESTPDNGAGTTSL
ncbi:BPSS1780 family membrane protein [Trinickia sp. NRRL B-1857]|uniref:BPSS1780 family membrane protein n=1 Tax=Trinickia sp. NRRL B-1857 TaxID=3162879 RepID=UPI003D2C56F3